MKTFRSILAAVLAAAPSLAAAAGAAPLKIHLWHTNDVHGWIMARADPRHGGRLVGGAPALKALIDKDKTPKLVLDAGDWWQGTPEGSLTKGAASAETFNAVGYDATEIGNHEFDDGEAALKSLIGKLKMPVLAANIYGPDGKHVPWARQRVMLTVDGVKFGVFGLITRHMDALAFPEHIKGLTFRREVDEARDQVKALKREGSDVIVALTHVGFEPKAAAGGKPFFEGDQTIAREVPGIDVIVGGHSHTYLNRPYRDPKNGTMVVQAGSYLFKAGLATLLVDPRTHKLLSDSDRLIALRPERGTDPKVQAVVDRAQAEVGRAFSVVVATATAPLTRAGTGESGLGSWMADCYRDYARADAAIQNAGGIRSDIAAGPLTLRELFSVMPFDNEIVKLTMTGAQLRAALEHGVGPGRVAQVSGVVLRYRPSAPAGSRLASVEIGGAPLDDAKTYEVATLDFLVMGGDGYEQFKDAPQERTGKLARDVLRACAEREKTVAPPAPGRLTALED